MGRLLRLVAGNVAVFLLLLLVANAITAGIYDLSDWWSDRKEKADERVDLPNYVDKDHSRKIFAETRKLGTRYVPFVEWKRKPFRGETVNVDEAGDRVHRAPGKGERGVVRFFGGSTTWGTGVDDDHTIPALFNALHPDWTVHNHGESGYYSRQELERLESLVHLGEPVDLVVFYDGYNDVRELCRRDVDLTGHGRQAQLAALVEPGPLVFQVFTSGLRLLVQDLRKAAGRLTVETSRCMEDPSYGDRVAAMTLANWRTARAVAALAGAEFVAILQPVAAIGSPNLSHLADDSFSLDDYATAQSNPNKLGRGIDHKLVYPKLKEKIAVSGADWIHDATDAFDGDEFIYTGPCHVTENGNERMAKRISEIVSPILARRAAERTGTSDRPSGEPSSSPVGPGL
ncbi:MAG: SGNH/GDSL hydrolase family protein [Myxococcota bacterium]